MGRKKADDKDLLKHRIWTRLTDRENEEWVQLIKSTRSRDGSALLREIVTRRAVTIYQQDDSLEQVLNRFSAIRKELWHMGHNINQITKYFNSTPHEGQRELYALKAADEYRKVGEKIDELNALLIKLSPRWLQE